MLRVDKIAPQPNSLTESQIAQRRDARQLKDPTRVLYGSLSQSANRDVRRHLFDEQNGRCAYCERALPKDLSNTVIEHFHPRNLLGGSMSNWASECGQRAHVPANGWDLIEIAIGNLLLCCEGKSLRRGEGATCDASKANKHVCPDYYNPKGIDAATLVRIDAEGTAHAVFYPGADSTRAQVMIDSVFSINVESLKEIRRRIYTERLSEFLRVKAATRGRVPAATLRARAAARLRDEARRSEFGSTLLGVADVIEGSPAPRPG